MEKGVLTVIEFLFAFDRNLPLLIHLSLNLESKIPTAKLSKAIP